MHIENVHIHIPPGTDYQTAIKQSIEYMDQQDGKSHQGYFGPRGWAGATLRKLLSEVAREEARAPERTSSGLAVPAIGDYWQGQGGIYVGRGRAREGIPEHHLILPTDTRAIFDRVILGTYGIDVPGASSDHNGMANTIALADAGSELCKNILALDIEGHNDLYLMSRTDARLCMANVPELFEKEWYLTSTQYSSNYAWGQYFDHGGQLSDDKKAEARARAVRRLIL